MKNGYNRERPAPSVKSLPELRLQAEEVLQSKAAILPECLDAQFSAETRQMLHELRLHQVELEMQNDELRRAEQELAAARLSYFDMYDLAPVGYCTVSLTGMILEPNLTAAVMLGVTRDALKRMPISRFIFKDDQDVYYLHRKRLLETGEPCECELRMLKPDQTVFWAKITATMSKGVNDAPVCRVVLTDITESKLVAEALRQQEEQFRLVFEERYNMLAEHSRAYHWEIDAQGLFRYISPTCKKVIGYEPEDIVGKRHFYDLHPLDGREAFKQNALAVMARKNSFRGSEHLIQTGNGRCLLIATDGIPLLDGLGALTGYRGMDIDVTKRN